MSDEDFWFRTLFKIKLYEVSGESFQQLFQKIMEYRYPSDFSSVTSYGNQGDGGNDGWFPNEGRYFQVYGRKADSKSDSSSKKVIEDFKKLQDHWKNIKKYHFVYNDRFCGVPAPIQQKLQELQMTHNLEEASVWAGAKLERLFMELKHDEKEFILGGVPSQLPDFVDPSALSEILKHLADKDSPWQLLTNQTAPDFEEKITINGLQKAVAEYLNFYSRQIKDVDDFLNGEDIGLRQEIAQEMKELYGKSCDTIPDRSEDAPSTEDVPSTRYVWMVEQLIPRAAWKHPHSIKAYREAAQVVLAKYFEACDIYEHPSTITIPK
jgi:hypothetical protein